MIIKVMWDNGSYWLCDGVDAINVSDIPNGVGMQDEKVRPIKCSPTSKVVASVFEERQHANPGQSKQGACIEFFDKIGDSCVVLFNTVAYICNENGKTIETIFG